MIVIQDTIVALIVTRGLRDFLLNALTGLARVGIDMRIVHVARPQSAADEVDPILENAGAIAHPFEHFGQSSSKITIDRYADFGTETFIEINWIKVRYLRWLLSRHDHVVYADLDVGWLADPLWYLRSVAQYFPLAFQTEALRQFPPVLCWGLLSAKKSAGTQRFLDTLLNAHDQRPSGPSMVDEQETCNALIAADPSWLSQIYLLPEGLFLNGLSYRSLVNSPPPVVAMEGSVAPFTFHANWTMGLENKRCLMRQTGTWLMDGDTVIAHKS